MLGALSDDKFEQAVTDAREATTRAFRNVVNAVAMEQRRETYRARCARPARRSGTRSAGGERSEIAASFAQTRHGSLRSTLARASSVRPSAVTNTWPLRAHQGVACRRAQADDCALLLWGVCGQISMLPAKISWGVGNLDADGNSIWVKTKEGAEVGRSRRHRPALGDGLSHPRQY